MTLFNMILSATYRQLFKEHGNFLLFHFGCLPSFAVYIEYNYRPGHQCSLSMVHEELLQYTSKHRRFDVERRLITIRHEWGWMYPLVHGFDFVGASGSGIYVNECYLWGKFARSDPMFGNVIEYDILWFN